MLRPAILYHSDIEAYFQNAYNTEKLFLFNGNLENRYPDITEFETECRRQYAIVSENNYEAVGYFEYMIDYVNDTVYRIGIFSFENGNPLIAKDVFDKISELYKRFHRIEWCMIGGNPAERNYDALIKRFGGNKMVLRYNSRDLNGKWRDSVIYEIINESLL